MLPFLSLNTVGRLAWARAKREAEGVPLRSRRKLVTISLITASLCQCQRAGPRQPQPPTSSCSPTASGMSLSVTVSVIVSTLAEARPPLVFPGLMSGHESRFMINATRKSCWHDDASGDRGPVGIPNSYKYYYY